METRDKHVVIIGGGFGGLTAAKALASARVQVTLVDRHNHHLFQPLLYQVATAGLAPGSIAVPIRSVVAKHANIRVLLGEAAAVDKEAQRLTLADGTVLPYDYLIVAVGARNHFFGNDEWAEVVHGLKELREALTIREKILVAFEHAEQEEVPERKRERLTFAIIGGGPTGVEMAGAISELGRQILAKDFRRLEARDIRVVLVEMGDRLLSTFDLDLSHAAARQLEELGVEIWLGTRVVDIDGRGVTVVPREEPEGPRQRLNASVVVWGSGVRPAAFIETLGVATSRDGRALVDASCAALGHPEIFIIGDCAAYVPDGQEDALPGVAPVAMQQGKHVARCIHGELRRRPRPVFRYTDKGMMATIGRSRAVLQGMGMKAEGLFAWLAWSVVHVLYLIGFRNRFIVMFNWFWSYVTFKRGDRLITDRVPSQGQTASAEATGKGPYGVPSPP